MKPKRQERPQAYYEARSLLAECFGLNEDSEIPQDYDDLPPHVRAAVNLKDKE